MIIFLSELQKEHLKLLTGYPTKVFVDFCKLAIDFINNGINHTKIDTAASKLDVSSKIVQDVVQALVFLLIEGCKHNLSESDFKSSLAIAGFSPEQQELLVKLYNTKRMELSECLYLLQQRDLVYQDLDWRLEVQVSSRHHNEEVKPSVTMDFVLQTPKNFGQQETTDAFIANKGSSTLYINNSITEATAASQCQNVISHVMLQCDLPNLVHMTNKLDQALKESKSQHIRKVKRALQ